MKLFRADLHVHTVLSPCGSLEMAPDRIVQEAIAKNLNIIAITDHNSTRQCRAVMEAGNEKGLLVIGGAEINTREEVHCLTFFESIESLDAFQVYLDQWLPNIPNNPDKFGHQVWVNRNEEILGEEKRLLWSGLNQSIEDVAREVHQLGGIFIPAHVNRQAFGLFNQLGFVPEGLQVDALEVTPRVSEVFLTKTGIKKQFPLIMGSDAHNLAQIGTGFTWLRILEPSFSELKLAIQGKEGRKAWPNGALFQEGGQL
jgi:PHP family Zn ribbon phosphoesterase